MTSQLNIFGMIFSTCPRYSVPMIVGGIFLVVVLLRITYRTRTNPFNLARQALLLHIARRHQEPVQVEIRQAPATTANSDAPIAQST